MTRFNNKKKAAIMLTGTLALTGAISAIPMPMFQNGMAAVVYAADGTEYSTVKGIATMGTGQAHIDIAGNEGQTLVGKKFNVYKLFEAENPIQERRKRMRSNPISISLMKMMKRDFF